MARFVVTRVFQSVLTLFGVLTATFFLVRIAGDPTTLLLPPEATDNIYALTDAERLAEGITALPGSLRDALDSMERSELMAEALGEHVFENFLVNKRREWIDYKAYVTPFEIERSLGTL